MSAYYNEIDPAAAHILRAQIAAGVIAPGDIDTRSIKEVSPDDLRGYAQCHFFAGGGLWSVAARLAGWPDDRPLWTGSCPCQPFSAAGKGLGTDDPRHLWPDFYRLIRALRPPIVMGEQVARAAGYGWFDGVRTDLANEGFASRTVDFPACSVDAPHQRNRLYWIAVEQPASIGRGEGRSEHEFWSRRSTVASADAFGSLADADGRGCRSPRQRGSMGKVSLGTALGERALAQRNSDGGILPDDDGGGRAGREESALGQPFERTASKRPLLRNGTYWSDAEWIVCHDDKARRAQSGIRFLVDGLPGRVDLWRVGGNAIVPEAAAEVIAAFMDVYGLPELDRRAA